MKKRAMFLTVVMFALVSTGWLYATDNWPHWRGPLHNGIVDSQTVPTTWSLNRNIKWKTPLPSWSAATPIIWGDRVFVTSPSQAKAKTENPEEGSASQQQGQRRRRAGLDPGGSELFVYCVSKKDGSVLWKQLLDNKNEIHRKQNDATPSPVTDGKHVWVVTGTGVVTALDMDGKIVWKKDLQQDYGPFGLNWGYASSPLLFEGALIIEVLHGYRTDDSSYIISLDSRTGKVNWKQDRPTDAQRESPDAYTTPIILRHGGQSQIVISGGDYVTGHDPRTGKEIWRASGLNPLNRPNYRIVGSPIINGDIIYAPTRKKPLLALKAGGTGDISESHLLWKYEGSGAPDVPSPICDGIYLYLVEDRGLVTCLNAETGEVIYEAQATQEGIVSASPIIANGKMYILNEKGVTTIVATGPEFRILGTNELDGTYTLASPAVSDSQLFIRTSSHLYCIEE